VDLFHQPYLATTSGLDENLQGISTDPFGQSIPSSIGLRIPPVLAAGSTPDNQPRYLFLLDTRVIERDKTVIRGIRQGLTIGINRSAIAGRELIYEFPVTSPWWRFPDGNVSWHLVREPNDEVVIQHPLSDAASWRYLQSDDPAMLYKTASFAPNTFNPSTLAPLYYPVGLVGYTPPDLSAFRASPIANLGNLKGIVYPWQPESDDKLNVVVNGNCRISLYASLLQTNPRTRLNPTALTAANVIPCGIAPEDAFVSNFTSGGGDFPFAGPIYWRIFGSILFDDAFGAD
jgi:hypothetical protein